MRTLETVSSVFSLVPILLILFAPGRRLAIRVTAGLAVVVILLQAIWEGPHWQLVPLYLAGVLLLGWAIRIRPWPRQTNAVLAISAVTLIAATATLSWLIPMFRLPQPTGQYAVGTRILHFVDPNRAETAGPSPSGKRELMVQVWYPISSPIPGTELDPHSFEPYQRLKEVTAVASYRSVLRTNSRSNVPVRSGPFPVLLYNPGWQGERTEGTYQAEELASHGFIVIAIDHTFYGGKVEFPDRRVADSRDAPVLGSFEHSTADQQATLGAKFVRIEADDDTFVLNQFEVMNQQPSSDWYHRLDMNRVGAMGFSIGGAVAEQTAIQDARVKAALDLDGWSFGDMQIIGMAKPLMVIYEDKRQTLPTASQLTSGSPSELKYWRFSQNDYDHVLRSISQHGGYILFIAGTAHVDFTDRSLFSPIQKWTGRGDLGPPAAHKIINAYTLAFFAHALEGSEEPLLEQDPSPYQPVEIHQYSGH